MTTHQARRIILTSLMPLLLLATGCDSENGTLVDVNPPDVTPGAFMIQSEQVAVRPTTLEGTFKASGLIDDYGTSKEVIASAEPLYSLPGLYGQKTLEGTKGTIKIEFYVHLKATDHNTVAAKGGFRVLEGSGDYAGLEGSGEIDLEVSKYASPAEITEILEGEARYVHQN